MSSKKKVGLKANEFVFIPNDWKERFKNVTGKDARGSWTVTYSYLASKGIPVIAKDLFDIAADTKRNSKGFCTRGGKPGYENSVGAQNVCWFANNGIFTVFR
jgi:hypothetical protein